MTRVGLGLVVLSLLDGSFLAAQSGDYQRDKTIYLGIGKNAEGPDNAYIAGVIRPYSEYFVWGVDLGGEGLRKDRTGSRSSLYRDDISRLKSLGYRPTYCSAGNSKYLSEAKLSRRQ